MMEPSVLGHVRVMNLETAWARAESLSMEKCTSGIAPGAPGNRRSYGGG